MSNYFDRVEQDMCRVVARRGHRPWYRRVLGVGKTRALMVVIGALVVATPAVGAVTHWFGLGAPDHFPAQSATLDAGRAIPASSQLLALRIKDPQGGPPWGVRLVHTTRQDTCIQLGRVAHGELGSLGIDDAWNNDRLFHPFPNTSQGDDCGTTDAVGNGFLNIFYTGFSASANPTAGASGAQATTCRPAGGRLGPSAEILAQLPARTRKAIARATAAQKRIPVCPVGSDRMIAVGLLGPDARSITYEAPNGTLRTEKTSGRDGAYLLVFPRDAATCRYTQGPFGGPPCSESVVSEGNASPSSTGAVKAVTYTDGHTCATAPPTALVTAQNMLFARMEKLPGGIRGREATKLRTAFLAARHLKPGWESKYLGGACPAVGYVAPKVKKVTAAMVATPLHVKQLASAAGEFVIDITFTAREPVTSSSSWYEDDITNPPGCPSGSQAGEIEFGDIQAGTTVHDKRLIGTCTGTYRGVIGYLQNSGPIDQNSAGGGTPGTDGSIVVGRFSITIR